MTTKEAFSSRLKALREKEGLSQDALAKSIGISRASLGHYENGDRQPNIEILDVIARHFNVSADYLIGRDDASPEAAQLADALSRLSEAQKKIKNLHYAELLCKKALEALVWAINDESEES